MFRPICPKFGFIGLPAEVIKQLSAAKKRQKLKQQQEAELLSSISPPGAFPRTQRRRNAENLDLGPGTEAMFSTLFKQLAAPMALPKPRFNESLAASAKFQKFLDSVPVHSTEMISSAEKERQKLLEMPTLTKPKKRLSLPEHKPDLVESEQNSSSIALTNSSDMQEADSGDPPSQDSTEPSRESNLSDVEHEPKQLTLPELKMLECIEEFGLSGQKISAGIVACGRLKRPDAAITLFKVACDHVGDPEVSDYGALIHALALNGEMEKAYEMVEYMKSQRIDPNLAIWSSMIQGYCKVGDFVGAWKVYQGMKRYTDCRPDEVTYTVLIGACARQGLVEKGLGLFYEMEHVAAVAPTLHTFHAVLMLYASRGMLREMDELLVRMEGYGYTPGLFAHNICLMGCAKRGDVDELKRWMRKMQERQLVADRTSCTAIIQCYAKAVESRSEYREKLRRQNLKYNPLALMREADEAFRWLVEDQRIAPDVRIMNNLMLVYCKVRRYQKALYFYQNDFRKHGVTPNEHTFAVLVGMHCRLGNIETAETLIDEMIMKHNLSPTPQAVQAISLALVSSGEPDHVDRAFDWLRILKRVGFPTDPLFRRRFRNAFHKAQAIRELALRQEAVKARRREMRQRGELIEPASCQPTPSRHGKLKLPEKWWLIKPAKLMRPKVSRSPESIQKMEKLYSQWTSNIKSRPPPEFSNIVETDYETTQQAKA